MVSRVSLRSVLVGVVLCFAVASVTVAGSDLWEHLNSLKSKDDTIAKLISIVENTDMKDVFRTKQITVFLPPITDAEEFRPNLPYHVIREKVHSDNPKLTTPQVFATYLSENGPYYLLDGTGKQGQALIMYQGGGKTMVEGGNTVQAVITGSIKADNGFVHRIDRMLEMPGNLSNEMQVGRKRPPAAKFQALMDSLGWVSPWDAAAPVTAFIPTDNAMAEANDAIQNFSDEEKKALVSTHLVHGAVAYANGLESRTLTNHAREKMTFAREDGKDGVYTYTSQEDSTLSTKVVKSDAFTRNGVIHFVDNVLISTKARTSGRGQKPPPPKSLGGGRGEGSTSNAGKDEGSSSGEDDSEDGEEDQPGGDDDGGSKGGDGTKPTTTDSGRSSKPDPKPVKPSSAHRSYPSLLIGSLIMCVMSALLL